MVWSFWTNISIPGVLLGEDKTFLCQLFFLDCEGLRFDRFNSKLIQFYDFLYMKMLMPVEKLSDLKKKLINWCFGSVVSGISVN